MSFIAGFINRCVVCCWLALTKIPCCLLLPSLATALRSSRLRTFLRLRLRLRLPLLFILVSLSTACHSPANSQLNRYAESVLRSESAYPANPASVNPASVNPRSSAIPAITTSIAALPAPNTLAIQQPGRLYTVSVNRVPASEVLSALARDTGIQLTLVGRIEGDVTLNAVNQPLSLVLEKLQQQVPIRYRIDGSRVTVSADVPFVKSYPIDYLNISRSAQSRVSLATQIGSLKTDLDDGGQSSNNSNGSSMQIQNESEHRFWDSLVNNVAGIIGDPPPSGGAINASGADDTTGDIFVNRESGILSVRATDRQHRLVESLINKIVGSARRQVLIEATVVEVTLSDSFESGVDWQILDNNDGTAIDYAQLLTGSPAASEATTPKTSILSYRNSNSRFGYVSATLKLLQQFGDVQVLSSPKIIALNNQPAVLKVVDNRVYFSFEIDRMQRENGDERTVVESTIHSVPIGLVMNVTPFINDTGEVILNVRPTISRILNFANDPSPALAGQSEIQNLIPEIQVREMESLLRVQSGDVAIIGGLMQNRVDDRNSGLPLFGSLPVIGKVFSQSQRSLEKTELLVFLRPTVLHRNASAPVRASDSFRIRADGNNSSLSAGHSMYTGQSKHRMKRPYHNLPAGSLNHIEPAAPMKSRQYNAYHYPETLRRDLVPAVPMPGAVPIPGIVQ